MVVISQDEAMELRECPFGCGYFCAPTLSGSMLGTAEELQQKGDVWEYTVRCNCGAEGPTKYTEAEAIAAWNTRAKSLPDEIGRQCNVCGVRLYSGDTLPCDDMPDCPIRARVESIAMDAKAVDAICVEAQRLADDDDSIRPPFGGNYAFRVAYHAVMLAREKLADETAYQHTVRLAVALNEKHYGNLDWKPLPDLLGMIDQIDNMVATLTTPNGRLDKRTEDATQRAAEVAILVERTGMSVEEAHRRLDANVTQTAAPDGRLDIARRALRDAFEAIKTLDEDALGMVVDGHGCSQYPVRDELLANLDQALAELGE